MLKSYVILCVALLFLTAVVTATEDVDYKAKFIVKLIDYVEWPAGAGADASGNIVVHVVGASDMATKLTESAAGTNITVKEVPIDDAGIAKCQILFMGTSETSDLAKILKKVNGTTVLTVSDAEYFGNYGVMINFYAEGDKTKFEVNKTVVDMSGIKISSKLLKLAKII
ncbi:MAG: YfiR family protein [Candidatus Zixiibacteriota bacterium]